MSITHIKRNNMGTCSFDGKFKGMVKPQDFIIYPIPLSGMDGIEYITVQSNTRIGHIYLNNGAVWMSKPVASGAYGRHMATATRIDTLSAEELFNLKAHVADSASPHAGTNRIVYTNNSGAVNALAL